MTLLLAILLVTVACVPLVLALPLVGTLAVAPLRRAVVRCDAQPIALRAVVGLRAPPV
jgi:hypothetical protein